MILPRLENLSIRSVDGVDNDNETHNNNALRKEHSPAHLSTCYRHYSSTPCDYSQARFVVCPPPLRLDAWSESPAESFQIRGATYLRDRRKVNSAQSVFRLLAVDLVKVEEPYWKGLCSHPNERMQQALKREQESGVQELPDFVFAVNICVPGQTHLHLVSYFGVDDIKTITTDQTPLGRLAYPFFFGESDEFRNQTFKLIPRIADGNFVVKKAVGSKPTILGRKLKQYYIRNERFLELMVDIGSESLANGIVKLSLGYAKTLVVDMMFLLEGHDESTLPEQILGGVRLSCLDLKKRDGRVFHSFS